MDGDVTGLDVGVDKVADQAEAVAVEVDADHFAFGVDHWAAGVASDGVGGGDEVEALGQIELGAILQPGFGQLVGRLIFGSLRAGEHVLELSGKAALLGAF